MCGFNRPIYGTEKISLVLSKLQGPGFAGPGRTESLAPSALVRLWVSALKESRVIKLLAQTHVGDVFRFELRCLGVQSMLGHES
jgi:hypothetical protein